jgi:DNA-binding MarR family transcriptional regulator
VAQQGNRFFAATILMNDDMAKGLAARELTPARANALWQISARGPLTQRQIADVLRVTPRNVTKLVDGLEQTGFVARTRHDTDRRAVLVRLTAKGEAAAVRMETESDTLAEDLFGALGPAELATLVRALDHVSARLTS